MLDAFLDDGSKKSETGTIIVDILSGCTTGVAGCQALSPDTGVQPSCGSLQPLEGPIDSADKHPSGPSAAVPMVCVLDVPDSQGSHDHEALAPCGVAEAANGSRGTQGNHNDEPLAPSGRDRSAGADIDGLNHGTQGSQSQEVPADKVNPALGSHPSVSDSQCSHRQEAAQRDTEKLVGDPAAAPLHALPLQSHGCLERASRGASGEFEAVPHVSQGCQLDANAPPSADRVVQADVSPDVRSKDCRMSTGSRGCRSHDSQTPCKANPSPLDVQDSQGSHEAPHAHAELQGTPAAQTLRATGTTPGEVSSRDESGGHHGQVGPTVRQNSGREATPMLSASGRGKVSNPAAALPSHRLSVQRSFGPPISSGFEVSARQGTFEKDMIGSDEHDGKVNVMPALHVPHVGTLEAVSKSPTREEPMTAAARQQQGGTNLAELQEAVGGALDILGNLLPDESAPVPKVMHRVPEEEMQHKLFDPTSKLPAPCSFNARQQPASAFNDLPSLTVTKEPRSEERQGPGTGPGGNGRPSTVAAQPQKRRPGRPRKHRPQKTMAGTADRVESSPGTAVRAASGEISSQCKGVPCAGVSSLQEATEFG